MTPEERANPAIIHGSRRLRIARGSGTTTRDVNDLLRQFAQARKMMKQMMGMAGLGGRGGLKMPKLPPGMGLAGVPARPPGRPRRK
jgi:signal recognition particle subunit SRP54